MNQMELYANLRECIGNPDPNQVTNVQLDRHIVPALEWLVVQLKYTVENETNFPLTTDQREYPLPRDLAWMITVEWNTQRLQAANTYKWDREGIDWRNIGSGTPAEFAIVQADRHIVLMPPPSASAIATAGVLVFRYVSSAPALEPGGTPQLSDLDQQLVIYRAAMRYLRTHITKENAEEYVAKIAAFKDELDDILPSAKSRAQFPIMDEFPSFTVQSDRFRGAR